MAPVNVMYLEAMPVIVVVIVCRWKMCEDASIYCGEGVKAMAAYYFSCGQCSEAGLRDY